MYLTREVLVAVNLRLLEVYRVTWKPGANFPAGGVWVGGFFTLPIKPPARNDSRAHESSFCTGKNVAKRERETESYRARPDEIRTRDIFRERFSPTWLCDCVVTLNISLTIIGKCRVSWASRVTCEILTESFLASREKVSNLSSARHSVRQKSTWQEQFKTHVGVYNRPAVSIARHSRRGREPSFRVDFCYRKSSAWPHISFFLSPWPASIRPHVCQDKHERWHGIVTSAYLLCMRVNWCQFELKLSGMANALLSLIMICFTYLLRARDTSHLFPRRFFDNIILVCDVWYFHRKSL